MERRTAMTLRNNQQQYRSDDKDGWTRVHRNKAPRSNYHHGRYDVMYDRSNTLIENLSLSSVEKTSKSIYITNLLWKATAKEIRIIEGRWVWIELDAENDLSSFRLFVEINKVFTEFKSIDEDFVLDERAVWIDIVGVPLCAWSSNAFKKIGTLWGESLFVDLDKGESLAHELSNITGLEMLSSFNEVNRLLHRMSEINVNR
nr:hypothetical protein [Tanacetum cinerariifolium]